MENVWIRAAGSTCTQGISHLSSHHHVSSKFSLDTVFPPCTKSVLYLMTHSSYIFSRGLYLIKLLVYDECIPLKPCHYTPTDCTEVHPDCDDNRIPPILTTVAKTYIDSLCVPCLVHVSCRWFSQRLVCWCSVEIGVRKLVKSVQRGTSE